ncbi:hypothetical protein BDR05DRAFT_24903 [Suillus weaverae]|nr:hypothetical protein BDR05DRAFT_24903 [Suillus weaverae]
MIRRYPSQHIENSDIPFVWIFTWLMASGCIGLNVSFGWWLFAIHTLRKAAQSIKQRFGQCNSHFGAWQSSCSGRMLIYETRSTCYRLDV